MDQNLLTGLLAECMYYVLLLSRSTPSSPSSKSSPIMTTDVQSLPVMAASPESAYYMSTDVQSSLIRATDFHYYSYTPSCIRFSPRIQSRAAKSTPVVLEDLTPVVPSLVVLEDLTPGVPSLVVLENLTPGVSSSMFLDNPLQNGSCCHSQENCLHL
ncbi:hypothetical protein G5714_012599 [Onychostoma macrolepis]|uniref:Uncharacterized protein n=1 Tax=Onychostoma macrolepis TaxID=369639 RepID=A0A7J6CH14_9TELE|nr:hypothetical protein G5714_012599 [Onychostoma macrolepis]